MSLFRMPALERPPVVRLPREKKEQDEKYPTPPPSPDDDSEGGHEGGDGVPLPWNDSRHRLEDLNLGGQWWSHVRFVRDLSRETGLAFPQFDFVRYRLQMFVSHPRPDLEYGDTRLVHQYWSFWGQLGWFVLWAWQRVNYARVLKGKGRLQLWQLMDNQAAETWFVQLVVMAYTSSKMLRDTKTPTMRQLRHKEQQTTQLVGQLTDRIPNLPVADARLAEEDAKSMPRAEMEDSPDLARLSADSVALLWKHLLLKWCAQAMHIPTAQNVYQLEGLNDPTPDALTSLLQPNAALPYAAGDVHVWDRPPLINPSSIYARPHPRLDPSVIGGGGGGGGGERNREKSFNEAINNKLNLMDGSVVSSYYRALSMLWEWGGAKSYQTVDEIERRLLTDDTTTLCDKAFFAWMAAHLFFSARQDTVTSQLTAGVLHKAGVEWNDLREYFTRWQRLGNK